MAKVCLQCGREFGNSSTRCPICKCDLVSDGIDNSENARKERLQKLQEQKRDQITQTASFQNYQNPRPYERHSGATQRTLQKQGPSGLSVTALVFSLLACFSVVGLILGIVDLCVNRNRKKTCSVLALVFSGLWIIGTVALIAGSSSLNMPQMASGRNGNSSNIGEGGSSSSFCSVGDTISGSDWKITLESAKVYDEIPGKYYSDSPGEGMKYLVLFFEVENVSDEDNFFNHFYVESYLDGYNANYSVTMSEPEGYGMLGGNVGAGKKLKGCLKYKVSSDWNELEVSYKKWIGTSEKIATFVVTPDKVR